jgi:signal transduction histidine kinase
MLHLSIDDDGVGVTPEVRAGVGLLSMRERAEELGGRCVVEACPGGGTRVAVRLPLVRRQAAPAAAATSYGKEPVGE